MLPEDFGGHRVAGLACPWDMEEFRCLQGVNETVRGAAFRCRFASADQKHPVGILTNLPSLFGDLHLGWPDLQITGDQLSYHGPLPRACPCRVARSSASSFCPALAPIFTFGFWARIFCALREDSNPVSLTDRGESFSSGPSSSCLLPVSSSSFSLSSTPGSLQPLFLAWSSRCLPVRCSGNTRIPLSLTGSFRRHQRVHFLWAAQRLVPAAVFSHCRQVVLNCSWRFYFVSVPDIIYSVESRSFALQPRNERAPGLSETEENCR